MFTHAGASRRRLHAGAGLLLALTGLLGGCAARVVDLQRITISARPADGPVEALGFHGDVSASGFTGEQLVYEVTVLDRDGDPLLSRDGRYQNRAGHVAAGKTVMVWQDVATFENLTVTLPLREVPADQGGRAVWARFAVYDRAGRMLAEREMPFLMPKRDYAAEMTRSGPPRNAVPGAGSQPPATAMGPVMPTGARRLDRPDTTASDSRDTMRPAANARSLASNSPNERESADNLWDRRRRNSAPGARQMDVTGAADDRAPATTPRRTAPASREPARSGTASGLVTSWSQLWRQTARARDAATVAVSVSVLNSWPCVQVSERSVSRERTVGSSATRDYVAQEGDTLTWIALNELGDANRWNEIFELNRDQLETPDSIRAGMRFRIPSAPGRDRH